MADYSAAASELKSRWDASAKKFADLDAFFRGMIWCLPREVESANKSLDHEGCPQIEFEAKNPLELTLVSAKCRMLLEPNENKIVVSFVNSKRSRQLSFQVEEGSKSPTARKTGVSLEYEGAFSPVEAAASIVEDLIAEAP